MAYKQVSPIPVVEGGTGSQTLTDHAVLIGSGTAAITAVGPVASTGALLASNGVGSDPGFTTATYPLTTVVSEILYSSATNTVTGLATANSGVLTTGATGVPVITAIATDGQFIIGSTAGAPAAGTITSTGATITVTPGANTINLEAVATGDVTGPGSSTDRAIATWDGVNGDALFDNSTITISANGEMVNTAQPAFLAYLPSSDNNVTGNGTVFTLGSVTALTEVFDQNSDFVTTGTFTAPVTGRYEFTSNIRVTAGTTATSCNPSIITSNRTYEHINNLNAVATWTATITSLSDMDAADTTTFAVVASGVGSDTSDVVGAGSLQTYVCGSLIC